MKKINAVSKMPLKDPRTCYINMKGMPEDLMHWGTEDLVMELSNIHDMLTEARSEMARLNAIVNDRERENHMNSTDVIECPCCGDKDEVHWDCSCVRPSLDEQPFSSYDEIRG